MRKYLIGVLAVAIFAVAAPAAFAVHEANNQFDLAVTATGPAGADGSGSSNFIKGGTQGGNGPVWKNRVEVSGLKPNTMYTWVGIAMGTASSICSFTTDASGSGGCESGVNSRLGSTEIREGGVAGIPVLRAVSSTDDDNKVEDGEIERRGTCRFDENPGCQAG
ncbi:MAG: fibronectin type III domain-containing protein [Actinobacteria bacterium]|nr:fibronectin type III domain-containing protein [Actinomycetota bacterium]